MATSENDLASLPLNELLSAPLTAAAEAQQQASLGLVGFILDVGFTDSHDQGREVRMVEFQYVRDGRDANGEPVRFPTLLRLPLLALLSLPRLDIDKLNVNVLMALKSVTRTKVSPRLQIPAHLQERYPFLRGNTGLRVAPSARAETKGGTHTTRPYDLEISLVATGEEPNDGIDRLLTALTGLMTEDVQ
ncbi:DUF2589 domain-containing protein [Streptomyces sp. NPDC002888]|uniref:DUF2589 domain-containing protein n=1 Tax=Streptomyces sp. NPDC002888 TaxID=3364668 RepID=UPI00368A1B13